MFGQPELPVLFLTRGYRIWVAYYKLANNERVPQLFVHWMAFYEFANNKVGSCTYSCSHPTGFSFVLTDVRASLPFSFPPDNAVDCHSTQLIDGDATFNLTGLESFLKDVKLDDRGRSYVVVSIMGPQCSGESHVPTKACSPFTPLPCTIHLFASRVSLVNSWILATAGKSTLMNHLFGTNFKEMDALAGRYFYSPLHPLLMNTMWCIMRYYFCNHKFYFLLGPKQPEAFGWQKLLELSHLLLWWTWRVPMEQNEERYL